MTETGSRQFSLSDLTLDLARGRLWGPQGDIALRAKSFALLCHFARNAGQVLTKDNLLSAVWPDVTATEDSLTQCIRDIRRALGDGSAHHLRTIPRRGYLFSLPNPVPDPIPAPNRVAGSAQSRHPGSIAILPLVCDETVTPTDQLLFDGLANDIISRLARLRSFHIISRGSTFALREHAGDPLRAAGILNVAYAVAGSVARMGQGFRLRIDLVDAQGGTIVWTDEMVITPADIVGIIGPLSDRIASLLAFEVTAEESRRALTMPETSMDAWELFHRGLDLAFHFDAARIPQALHFFEAATHRDPGFARAHAGTSFCHFFLAFSGQCADREVEKRLALLASERAIEADNRNPTAHWARGRAIWLAGDAELGLSHCRQAVELCPGFAHAHYMIGFIEAHHGDPRRALVEMDRVEAFSPFDPFIKSVQITRAVAYFRLGDLDQATHWARQATRHSNAYNHMLCHAALILSAAGHLVEAAQIVVAIRNIDKTYTAAKFFDTFYGLRGDELQTCRHHAGKIGL